VENGSSGYNPRKILITLAADVKKRVFGYIRTSYLSSCITTLSSPDNFENSFGKKEKMKDIPQLLFKARDGFPNIQNLVNLTNCGIPFFE
jgi:hypothetical protein